MLALSQRLGTPNISANANTTLTGVTSSFNVNSVSIGLVQQVNVTGNATNFTLGSSSIAA